MSTSVKYQVMPPLSPDEYRELHDDIAHIAEKDGFAALDKQEIDWFIDEGSDLQIVRSAIVNAMWRKAHPGWRSRPTSGQVYFIEAPSVGVVKIGYSSNAGSRFNAICGMSPVPLRLVAAFPGGAQYERDLHEKFSHLRSHGEWFFFTDEIKRFIGEFK